MAQVNPSASSPLLMWSRGAMVGKSATSTRGSVPSAASPPQTPEPAASKPTSVVGDVDGDGKVGVSDGRALLSYLFQGESPIALENGDVNGDGSVNLADAMQLLGPRSDAKPGSEPTAPPATPAGVVGDVDGDGQVTAADGRALLSHLFQGESAPGAANADVDGNGVVNISDAMRLLGGEPQTPIVGETDPTPVAEGARPLAGDVDGNGVVDAQDGKALLSHLYSGTKPAGLANADVNGDGKVNLADATSIFASTMKPAADPVAAVPTPTQPEAQTPLVGDVDGNEVVDAQDGKALLSHLYSGTKPEGLANADVNGDGSVNLADATSLFANTMKPAADPIAAVPTPTQPETQTPLVGDVDGNGVVDASDGKALLSHLYSGTKPEGLANADVNGDGSVNLADATSLFASTMKPAADPIAAVPTPTQPETQTPLVGDVDGNGVVDASDGKAILSHLYSGTKPEGLANADVNGDGSVNLADATSIFASTMKPAADPIAAVPTPTQPETQTPLVGDVDGNGVVDASDGKAILSHLFNGTNPEGLANADVNGDGTVNLADATTLFGDGAAEAPAVAGTPVAPTYQQSRAQQSYARSLGLLAALSRNP